MVWNIFVTTHAENLRGLSGFLDAWVKLLPVTIQAETKGSGIFSCYRVRGKLTLTFRFS